MATSIVAHDFQTAQALYQRSLQGELMEVNKQGQIRTASFGTRVVSALIGAFQGADAKDAYVSGKQREVAQAFRALIEAQPRFPQANTLIRDRSASVDTLDGRDISVKPQPQAENPYELPTDAQALAAQRAASNAANPASAHDNPTYESTPEAGIEDKSSAVPGEVIPAYAQGNGTAVLNYTTDPSLAHLKETAHFVKAEIEQHGTDAGRALQNIGVLKTLNNANRASNGEILQALTPQLKAQYDSELGRLKGERAERAVGQKAADAAYRAASLDNPNLPIHELLNRPLFADAPLAQRYLADAYMDKVSTRHARGEANYDAYQPSREVIADRNIQRDALRAEFGLDNKDSAIAKALAAANLSEQERADLQDAFDDQLTPLAADAVNRSAFADGLTTAQFASEVEALVAQVLGQAA
jgi:hypothetical protein